MMSQKIDSAGQVADVIERFLLGSERYPQEFNDFFECSLSDPQLDAYRKRCEILHVEFEPRRGQSTARSSVDGEQRTRLAATAVKELARILAELRLLEQEGRRSE
jgi:hypothetical protein